MANTSADPDSTLATALARGYVRVRFQQGKPLLDRELTLAADLASPRRIAARYVGDGVADADGFRIFGLSVATNDFKIHAGTCLVGGLEVALAADTTYRTQPNTSHVAPLPAGTSRVYLRVFTREVSGSDDADLLNAADVGFETARRDKADWEVVVSSAVISAVDHFLLATIDTAGASVTDQRRVGLALAAVRDEVATARGSAASLGARLGTSLDALGSLRAGTVGSTQLVAKAVTEPALGDLSVSKRTLQAGAVSVAKLANSVVFNGTVSLAAAPSATTPSEVVLTLLTSVDPAFFLTSVSAASSIALISNVRVDWFHRAHLTTSLIPAGTTRSYELVLRNNATVPVSVACKVYRILEA